jgi:hypothetical protein
MLVLVLACSAESTMAPTPAGKSAAVTIEPNYSFSITPGDRTVYVRFSRVRGDGKESVSAFMQRVFASADAAGATRLVVDLSATKGGDSFLVVPLLKGILSREQFTRRGGLTVILGPDSYSAAQSTATVLETYASPVFIGIPGS